MIPLTPAPDGQERTTMTRPGGRIVVGVDGSPASLDALRFAHRQAQLTGAELHAMTTWTYPLTFDDDTVDATDWQANAESVLDIALAEALPGAAGAEVLRHVAQGHPAGVLLGSVGAADLLVVGSRGHGGFAGMLLGSVSQHVVAHSPCPVVVVR
jgi:nucleotide-binding universal stress UspA family protein